MFFRYAAAAQVAAQVASSQPAAPSSSGKAQRVKKRRGNPETKAGVKQERQWQSRGNHGVVCVFVCVYRLCLCLGARRGGKAAAHNKA